MSIVLCENADSLKFQGVVYNWGDEGNITLIMGRSGEVAQGLYMEIFGETYRATHADMLRGLLDLDQDPRIKIGIKNTFSDTSIDAIREYYFEYNDERRLGDGITTGRYFSSVKVLSFWSNKAKVFECKKAIDNFLDDIGVQTTDCYIEYLTTEGNDYGNSKQETYDDIFNNEISDNDRGDVDAYIQSHQHINPDLKRLDKDPKSPYRKAGIAKDRAKNPTPLYHKNNRFTSESNNNKFDLVVMSILEENPDLLQPRSGGAYNYGSGLCFIMESDPYGGYLYRFGVTHGRILDDVSDWGEDESLKLSERGYTDTTSVDFKRCLAGSWVDQRDLRECGGIAGRFFEEAKTFSFWGDRTMVFYHKDAIESMVAVLNIDIADVKIEYLEVNKDDGGYDPSIDDDNLIETTESFEDFFSKNHEEHDDYEGDKSNEWTKDDDGLMKELGLIQHLAPQAGKELRNRAYKTPIRPDINGVPNKLYRAQNRMTSEATFSEVIDSILLEHKERVDYF